MRKKVFSSRNNEPSLLLCSSWKHNKDDSKVLCKKNETHCAVKRDFKTKFSNILMKVGGYERFLMGFHIFAGTDYSDTTWESHNQTPIRLRILDYTNFTSAVASSAVGVASAIAYFSLF